MEAGWSLHRNNWNLKRNRMQMDFNRRSCFMEVSVYSTMVIFLYSLCVPLFFLTPTLWQMVPHKSHTQISSQGNASLLLKRGTNVRWIWDEFALWIKFTGPRWLLPWVYQETTILLYFISYNSERIFYILAPEECRVEGNVMQSSSGYWTQGQTVNTQQGRAIQTGAERELDVFKWDW